MMETRQVPNNVISRLAYELGWSDGELALKAGITRSRLNRIKNGRIPPSVRDALLISRALGCSLEQVFGAGPDGARVREAALHRVPARAQYAGYEELGG